MKDKDNSAHAESRHNQLQSQKKKLDNFYWLGWETWVQANWIRGLDNRKNK